tara:strand:+ start:575 stop:1747 length:1173 start_codon:yes stop_codon:yes gene_type:complete
MSDKTDAIIKKSKEEREARVKRKREASMMYCPDCKGQRPAQYRGRKRRGDLVHKTYRASCGHWIESGAQYSEDSTISINETEEWIPVKTSDDQVEEDYGFNSAEIAILNGTTKTIKSVRETQPQFSERYAKELRGKGLEVTERESKMSDNDTVNATWDAVPAEVQADTIAPTTPPESPEAEVGAVGRQRATLNNLIGELDRTEYDRQILILDQDDPPTVDPMRAAATNQRVGDMDIFAWANIVPRLHPDIQKSEFLMEQAATRSYPFIGRADAMIRAIVKKDSAIERNMRAWADDRLTFCLDMEVKKGMHRTVEFHCRRDQDDKGFMRLYSLGIFKEDFNIDARYGEDDSLYGRINKAKGTLWFLEQQEEDRGLIEGNVDAVRTPDEMPF